MKNVSQKIRKIRHTLKHKSQTQKGPVPETSISASDPSMSAKKPRTNATFQQLGTQQPESEEDIQRNLTELKREWEKSKPNKIHIQQLLKSTLPYRIELMRDNPDGSIAVVLSEFPCFTDSQYVSLLLYDEKSLPADWPFKFQVLKYTK